MAIKRCTCELKGSWQLIDKVNRECVYHGDAAKLAQRRAYLKAQIDILQWELDQIDAR